MRFLRFLKNELLYVGLNKEEFDRVKEPVGEHNRKAIISWAGIVGLFCIICLFIFRDPVYAEGRAVLFVSLAVSAVAMACALFLIKRFRRLLFPAMYLLQLSVLGTGIALAVVQPDKRTATMVAFALIIPVFFVDRTIITVALQTAAIIAFVVFGKNVIVPEVYSWGWQTLAVFSMAGVISGHMINKSRFERFVYADSAKKLADIQKNYNEELQKEVAAKTERIVELHDRLIIGMATMVESRDNSTGGHIRRTSAGVRILTFAIRGDGSLRLPEGFCEKLIKAAPMHDLGKIAVDDSILRMPGRFTPEEYDQMKTHAAEGARIVREILADTDDKEFRRIAENAAHYHHERFDGSGYPDRLKGEEIPLEARIMAIADVYDALVSKRVYKESYSFEKADEIILEGMGTQFDPMLEKYYAAARPKLEEYYAKNR
ncbi:MAG: HD domain-containing protein [Clostridia bacterium]|nr:HD domain-containing protein [Clostridia bacterium]